MNDPRLSSGGVTQLQTDRNNNYKTAPKAPNISNVPTNPKATVDTDNYRNDLLKNYCKDASQNGYDSVLEKMRLWGQGTKPVGKDDIDGMINSVSSNASDAFGQIKYLVCQQADGYIAPPLPGVTPDTNEITTLFQQAYDTPWSWTFYGLSLFLVIGFVAFYLYQVYNIKILTPGQFIGYLISVMVVFGLWIGLLSGTQCRQDSNDYYPGGYNVNNTWWIFLAVFIFCWMVIGIGYRFQLKNVMSIALAVSFILVFSGDMMLGFLYPQLFIFLVIVIRIILYILTRNNLPAKKPWSVPFISFYGMFVNRFININQQLNPAIVTSLFEVRNLGT